jgi:regulator of RNase E activity RraA
VEDRSAAGKATGQSAALLLEEGGFAFFPGILILADNHGVFILPEVQDALTFCYTFQQNLLYRQIVVGIEAGAFKNKQ